MKPIQLVLLSGGDRELGLGRMEHLAAALTHTFRTECRIHPDPFDISFARDSRRGQYYSTAILQRLERDNAADTRVLGITANDLYVPVLTFVFGEAQLEGNCAVLSTIRLEQEFYGLPHDENLFRERLLKEAVHELGHTFGLRHCRDWSCVMTSSNGVELVDVKSAGFCRSCRQPVFQRVWS